jgi:hypothetical protein
MDSGQALGVLFIGRVGRGSVDQGPWLLNRERDNLAWPGTGSWADGDGASAGQSAQGHRLARCASCYSSGQALTSTGLSLSGGPKYNGLQGKMTNP